MNVSTNIRQQKLLTSKKDDIQTEIEAEMASILSKVRADIETDAGAERKKRSKQLECIREDIQGDIERICLNEDNSMSKLAALNGTFIYACLYLFICICTYKDIYIYTCAHIYMYFR